MKITAGSLVLLSAVLFFPQSTRPLDVHIVDIQAHLFCEQSAEFTDDIIGDQPYALWNTTIGEGDADCASHSTLVLVLVEGPAEEYLGDAAVGFQAEIAFEDDAPEVILSRITELGITNSDGFYYVPMWLYDTGCAPLRLTAWIDGFQRATSRSEGIPFSCGE